MDQDENLALRNDPIVSSANTLDPKSEGANFELMGVTGTRNFDNDVIDVLKARKGGTNAEGNPITKALIVNEGKVEEWEQRLSNEGITDVEVLDVYRVQGRTIDEIYVNIFKTEEEHGTGEGSNITYNTDLYTAYSRATKYIYTGTIPVQNTLDTDLGADATEKNAEIAERKTEYANQLKQDLEIFKENWIGEIPSQELVQNVAPVDPEDPTAEKPVIPNDEDPEEGAIPEGGNSENPPSDDNEPPGERGPTGGTVPLDLNEREHKFKHPTNKALTEIEIEGEKYGPVDVGDEIEYVLGKHPDENGNDVGTIIMVKRLDDNTFRQVGILDDSELKDFPTDIAEKLRDAKSNAKKDGGWVEFIPDPYNKTYTTMQAVVPIVTGTIKTQPTKLKYNYDGNNPEPLTENKYEEIIRKVKNALFGEQISTPFSIRIFGTDKASSLNETHGLGLEAGIPYILFSNPAPKGSKSKIAKPQVVRLSPRKLNTNFHNDEYFAPIINFIADGTIFEQLVPHNIYGIGDPKYNKLLHAIARDRSNQAATLLKELGLDERLATDARVVEQAKKVWDHVYIDDNSREIKEGDMVLTKDGLPPYYKTEKGNNQKKRVAEISMKDGQPHLQVEGDSKWIPVSDMELANDLLNGPAQKAFNKLAKSNLMGGNKVIRVYKDSSDNRVKRKITTARGLLSTTDRESVKLFDPRYSTKATSEYLYRTAARELKKRNLPQSEFNKIINEITNNPRQEDFEALQGNISLKDLREMMATDAEGNSTANEGFGLRVPIPMVNVDLNLTGQDMKEFELSPDKATNYRRDTENFGIDYLEKYFETTFQDITPTTIKVAFKTAASSSGTKPAAGTKPSGGGRPRPKASGGMPSLKSRTSDPGKAITLDAAMKLFKKMVPQAKWFLKPHQSNYK
jgi:hypothetical protein